MKDRGIRYIVAMVAMFIGDRFPGSALAGVVRYSAMGYILLDMLLRARAGYLRRLPHWTSDSWRRYRMASAIPAGALLIFWCLVIASDFRLLVVGAAHSTVRAIWAGGMVVLLLVGAVGIVNAIAWLTEGDPSRQFARFQGRHRRSQTPDSAA